MAKVSGGIQNIETKRKCMVVEQSLICDYWWPRSLTGDEDVLAAEVKKARVANEDILLILRPPSFIGKDI